ncbi:MAG: radical SAM protein [Planctomycetota bacterium]
MNTLGKLQILSRGSRFDLACAGCGGTASRSRSAEGMWLYPVSLPNGGQSVMLKTLMSNACANDCGYCANRDAVDKDPCSLHPEEIASVFMELVKAKLATGLFLTSAVDSDPDATMERINGAARIVRKRHEFGGYIHLKILPGASTDAIRDTLSLASSVSVNIEVPQERAFRLLSSRKDYHRDILEPLRTVAELTSPGSRFSRVGQTTQFVVGASNERDTEIVTSAWKLYGKLHLNRVYYSAYQSGGGEGNIPGETNPPLEPADLLTREHRLYQVDYLFRDYQWKPEDVPYDPQGNLRLDADPKEVWVEIHPEFFPLRLSSSSRAELLRVPGLGPVTVRRILRARRLGRLRSLEEVGVRGKRAHKAEPYVLFE